MKYTRRHGPFIPLSRSLNDPPLRERDPRKAKLPNLTDSNIPFEPQIKPREIKSTGDYTSLRSNLDLQKWLSRNSEEINTRLAIYKNQSDYSLFKVKLLYTDGHEEVRHVRRFRKEDSTGNPSLVTLCINPDRTQQTIPITFEEPTEGRPKLVSVALASWSQHKAQGYINSECNTRRGASYITDQQPEFTGFGKVLRPYRKLLHKQTPKGIWYKTRFGVKKLRFNRDGIYIKASKKNFYLHRW